MSVAYWDKTQLKGKDDHVTLQNVLSFATATDRIPPGGFHLQPQLYFLHGASETLATASTCDYLLRLPTQYADAYETFEDRMVLSFKGCIGFGCV